MKALHGMNYVHNIANLIAGFFRHKIACKHTRTIFAASESGTFPSNDI